MINPAETQRQLTLVKAEDEIAQAKTAKNPANKEMKTHILDRSKPKAD